MDDKLIDDVYSELVIEFSRRVTDETVIKDLLTQLYWAAYEDGEDDCAECMVNTND